MKELICNLHLHSTYSDGSGDYRAITQAALKTEVDIIILTDHNILVKGLEGYHRCQGRTVLVLTGEEVHDQNRDPQKNHTLVIGAEKEMAGFAANPQELINEINKTGGMSFLAHPYEFDLPMIHEPNISWVNWEVENFTGLELWNGLSEFKTVVRSLRDGIKYLFLPEMMAHGPLKPALAKWDELLNSGKKVNVVGGSDAHAIKFQKSILKKTVFPYEFHFSAINNHLIVNEGLAGSLSVDKAVIYEALRKGSSFIGYDLPAPTRGFRFVIDDDENEYNLGEVFTLKDGATARINLPESANIRLIHNGKVISEQKNANRLTYSISQPGAYRVECSLNFLGEERGWIYSNPIYVKPGGRRLSF
jgi:predicted metal-dependent phosphoesterase TrpH